MLTLTVFGIPWSTTCRTHQEATIKTQTWTNLCYAKNYFKPIFFSQISLRHNGKLLWIGSTCWFQSFNILSPTFSSLHIHKFAVKISRFSQDFPIFPALARMFRSFRAYQCSSDQMQSLKDDSAHTTRAVGIAYRLWLPFSINGVFKTNITRRQIH